MRTAKYLTEIVGCSSFAGTECLLVIAGKIDFAAVVSELLTVSITGIVVRISHPEQNVCRSILVDETDIGRVSHISLLGAVHYKQSFADSSHYMQAVAGNFDAKISVASKLVLTAGGVVLSRLSWACASEDSQLAGCRDSERAVKVKVKVKTTAETNMARGDSDGEPNNYHHC
jgi:hypothetical protein